MNFLFWNVNQRPIAQLVTDVVSEHHVNIFALAEYSEIHIDQMLRELNRERIAYFPALGNSDRIAVFARFDPNHLTIVKESANILLYHLTAPGYADVLLGIVHLPSKRFMSDDDQSDMARRHMRLIEEVENHMGHSRTVLFGDFNMDPFERGMAGSEAFHAVMDRDTAESESRIVGGEERTFFYNPMWIRLGDLTEGPPGTYYYRNAGPLTYFWNTFDQVLVRPSLLEQFDTDRLTVLTKAGSHTLLGSGGRPDRRIGSDHLPLLFSLDMELEV